MSNWCCISVLGQADVGQFHQSFQYLFVEFTMYGTFTNVKGFDGFQFQINKKMAKTSMISALMHL